MRIRNLLLAGAVFPFAMGSTGFALEATKLVPAGMVLAQAVDCGNGVTATSAEECPTAEPEAAEEQQPEAEAEPEPQAAEEAEPEPQAAEEPETEPAAESQQQAAPEAAPEAAEEAPAEEAAAEEPAEEPAVQTLEAAPAEAAPAEAAPEQPRRPRREQRRNRDAAEQPADTAPETTTTTEQPAAEQPAATQEAAPAQAAPATQEAAPATQDTAPATREAAPAQAAPATEQPAVAEPATPDDVLRRAQRQRERLQRRGDQPTEQAAPEQPADAPQQQGTPEQPAAAPQQPAAAEAQQPAAPSVVEQQLEAQGDQEEANQIRVLREKLQQERAAAEAADPEAQDGDRQNRRNRDRAGGNQQADDGGDRRDRRGRRDRDRNPGEGRVVEDRGDRIIIDLGGGNLYVEQAEPDEGERLLYGARDVEVEDLPGGRTRTVVYRENGSQIVTIRDRRGDIIRRVRVTPNGREVVLIDNRYEEDQVESRPVILFEERDLPPLVIDIPEEEYIVDLGEASEQQVQGALVAPPVQEIDRQFTLEEVTRNERVRAYVPRIDLDTITFEFGSATIGTNQMRALSQLGQAMEEVLAERPDEVYLIEGHTDAVGTDYDNLILSDRRAEAVAVALSQNFDIPPENLVTEGYGEQYLKVETEGPSRENRRVSVRRITELLQAENQ